MYVNLNSVQTQFQGTAKCAHTIRRVVPSSVTLHYDFALVLLKLFLIEVCELTVAHVL